jgi:PAS domain S-box-containing protein
MAVAYEGGARLTRRTLQLRMTESRPDDADETARSRVRTGRSASEGAASQRFLLELGDALRPLVDPVAIQRGAVRLLGGHLEADRAVYVEANEEDNTLGVDAEFRRARVESIVGTHRMDDFGSYFPETMRSGDTVAISDVLEEPRLGGDAKAAFQALGIRSLVNVPLVKGGTIRAVLAVHQAVPRGWTDREVALVEETAERTWAAVERARAERALRESEERYRTLFCSIDAGLIVIDLLYDSRGEPVDWRFMEVNPTFEKQTGLRDAVGRTASELIPGLEREWLEICARVVATGEPARFTHEARTHGAWYEVYAFRVGRPADLRLAVLTSDVTARKLAERGLRESEKRFRAVADLVPDLLWRSNPSGFTTWYNHRWLEYTGQTSWEAQGWGWVDAIHPDDREPSRANYKRAAALGQRLEHAQRIRSSDGAYRWFLVRAEPVLDEHGEVQQWFGAATDVHEQRRLMATLEERVTERTRELRELAGSLTLVEQEQRRRISQVLHDDLQQLLYGIQMRLTMAQERAERGQMDALVEQTDRSLRLLSDAIMHTRQLTVDLSPPVLEGEGLVEVLRWLETHMRDLHALDVEIRGDPGIDVGSKEMRVLLFQCVRELLFNVAKHAETERATVEVGRVGERLCISVTDEGSGFEPESITRPGSGREGGFGLFSVRERLLLQGGEMVVASAPGEGTRAVVYAPLPPSS